MPFGRAMIIEVEMAQKFRRIVTILLSATSVGLAQAAENILTFAPLPMESPETVVGQWKPLLSHLERKLGIELKIDYSQSNQEILEKFRASKLDLAYLGPLPYVVLKENFAAAVPVALFKEANGQSVYTCAIVALAESKLAVKNLRNKTIALTQPLSTCGFHAADNLLRRAGTDLAATRYRYLNAHDAVALAVVRGDYDYGVLKTAIGEKYAHLGLITLAETAPLPSLGLVANSARLSAETIQRLRAALLEADPAVRAGWGDNIRHGAVPAADADYDPMRKLHSQRQIPVKGNF